MIGLIGGFFAKKLGGMFGSLLILGGIVIAIGAILLGAKNAGRTAERAEQRKHIIKARRKQDKDRLAVERASDDSLRDELRRSRGL